MNDFTTIEKAKEIMGQNFIGPEELNTLLDEMGIAPVEENILEVNYSEEQLKKVSREYILVLGTDKFNIINFRDFFGVDPDISEPCLYNQNWYLSEEFVYRKLQNHWYLIKKDVFEDTRAVIPLEIMQKGVKFPSAILCVYTFFAYFLAYEKMLWFHDFIWCEDVDHNGDRIYVGKYHDIDGVNKNGFSIHRHLTLRPCYSSVNCI
ncbi:MAG: hypothetical protein PHG64_09880 [Paludibacter sp.]|nr:hypothetical protein [Paludibacter sp.]